MADWNAENQNRFYPFQVNHSASGLSNEEILDARFFIINPVQDTPRVWLASRDESNGAVVYVFQNSAGGSMTFTAAPSSESQCIWNTEESDWYGYCVFGGTEA